MPDTKLDGTKEHTNNNFYKVDNREFRICS